MGVFLFRCPNTGFRVQGWDEDDESEESGEAYQGVICHAADGCTWSIQRLAKPRAVTTSRVHRF
jgi:hypothetical protein